MLCGILIEEPQRIVAQSASQKVNAASSQRHQSFLAGKTYFRISVLVIRQGVDVLRYHFGVEVLRNGHKEDVLTASDVVHQSSHLLNLLGLQVVETQVVFGEESGARLSDREELGVAVPLVVKLSQFIERVPKRPHFIADQPIGVGLPRIPIVHVSGVEGVAVDDDIVIQ